LLLIAWDGLSAEQAATVLGCSRRALSMRLHRARKRLSAALADAGRPEPRPTMETCND
jgi:RNA polymerase sigma-70 factor (ECF subfamily)